MKKVFLLVIFISTLCYADANLPGREYPAYKGERYKSIVPDTLDLAERMKLSLNGFTRCDGGEPKGKFPPTKHLCNHFIEIGTGSPKVVRNVNLYGKFLLGARLARIATGSELNMYVDNDWRNAWLQWQKTDPVMNGPEGGRRLEWVAFNIANESQPDNSAWEKIAEQAINRLQHVAVPHLDSLWLAAGNNIPDDGFAGIDDALGPKHGIDITNYKEIQQPRPLGWDASQMTWPVQGLCAIYRQTKNQQAIELAGKLAKYLKDYSNMIAPDGRLLTGHDHVWPVVHWHHSFQAALACAEYGEISKDKEFVDFANTTYKHVMTFCSPLVGYAPEYCYGQYPRKQDMDNTEACCSADLVLMALWLTASGQYDYWDDIDRYIRNHIAALQLTDTKLFYEMPQNRTKYTYPDPNFETVISPLVGNFGGWATANDWYDPQFGIGIMTCCIGNCTRAFYYVWDRMIEFSDGSLKVNLMLNRASQYADIKSYRPYEGKFEIDLKVDCRQVLVRAPQWVETGSSEIICNIDGKAADVKWEGRYLDCGRAKSGQLLTVGFPIHTKKVKADIGRRNYTLTIKGNTVIDIDPVGKIMPLYQRDYYSQNKAPLVEVERYVPKN